MLPTSRSTSALVEDLNSSSLVNPRCSYSKERSVIIFPPCLLLHCSAPFPLSPSPLPRFGLSPPQLRKTSRDSRLSCICGPRPCPKCARQRLILQMSGLGGYQGYVPSPAQPRSHSSEPTHLGNQQTSMQSSLTLGVFLCRFFVMCHSRHLSACSQRMLMVMLLSA